MSVTIKRPEELELMREAGKILAKVHGTAGRRKRQVYLCGKAADLLPGP